MNGEEKPLAHYHALKAAMDKDGISPVYHTPYMLEFLLQRERMVEVRLDAIEKHLNVNIKVLKE